LKDLSKYYYKDFITQIYFILVKICVICGYKSSGTKLPGCGRGIPWDCGSQDLGSNPSPGLICWKLEERLRMTSEKGILIVIEGSDGAGLSTQAALLAGYLRDKGGKGILTNLFFQWFLSKHFQKVVNVQCPPF
jgi:hypothetical protein